jgi:hypothetical protein
MEDVNMNSDSDPINQGAAPMVAEPTTLAEVKAADAAWFAANPDRKYRARLSYPCEGNKTNLPLSSLKHVTLVHQIRPGLRKRVLVAESDFERHYRDGHDAFERPVSAEELIEESFRREDTFYPNERAHPTFTDDDEADRQEALEKARRDQEERTRKERERKARIAGGKAKFADEAHEPLENNLQLVKFKLSVEHDDDDDASVKAAIERCFGSLGAVDTDGYDTTVELVTTAALVAQYLDRDGALVQGWSLNGARFKLVGGVETADSFNKKRRNWTFRGITAPHQGEYKSGAFKTWVEGVAAREEDFAGLLESIASCNGDVVEVAHQIEIHEQTEAEEDDVWLVEGLLKAGGITLLAGHQKHGKSSILRQLVGAIVSGEETWLGFPLNRDIDRNGLIIYLCGEDTIADSKKEISLAMGGKPVPRRVNILPARQKTEGHDYRNLRNTLAGFKHSHVALVIVDPTRVYYKGDEDDSDTASELFKIVGEFIQDKKCPVIMAHHLKKDSRPRCLDDIARMIRGSGVSFSVPGWCGGCYGRTASRRSSASRGWMAFLSAITPVTHSWACAC